MMSYKEPIPHRVSDPPPRPQPHKTDRSTEAWIPGGKPKRRTETTNAIRRFLVITFSVGLMACVAYIVYSVFQTYLK